MTRQRDPINDIFLILGAELEELHYRVSNPSVRDSHLAPHNTHAHTFLSVVKNVCDSVSSPTVCDSSVRHLIICTHVVNVKPLLGGKERSTPPPTPLVTVEDVPCKDR